MGYITIAKCDRCRKELQTYGNKLPNNNWREVTIRVSDVRYQGYTDMILKTCIFCDKCCKSLGLPTEKTTPCDENYVVAQKILSIIEEIVKGQEKFIRSENNG
jgi:hypothetical protein